MHWTNYRSAPGVPANLTHTFPIAGAGSGFASLPPPQDPTPTSQDPSIFDTNVGTNFQGYHTLTKDRTPEAVFMLPPEPHQVIPEYTTRMTVNPAPLPAAGAVRRVPRFIEPGEALVMLFDDGPRVVQALERAPYLIYSVRVRRAIIGTWDERKYAIVDPSSEIVVNGRQWYRFVQPTEMRASDVPPLMQSCPERKGCEFIDARPPGWHMKRRETEVPFLEMVMKADIDWDVTEWMVGGAGYGE